MKCSDFGLRGVKYLKPIFTSFASFDFLNHDIARGLMKYAIVQTNEELRIALCANCSDA